MYGRYNCVDPCASAGVGKGLGVAVADSVGVGSNVAGGTSVKAGVGRLVPGRAISLNGFARKIATATTTISKSTATNGIKPAPTPGFVFFGTLCLSRCNMLSG